MPFEIFTPTGYKVVVQDTQELNAVMDVLEGREPTIPPNEGRSQKQEASWSHATEYVDAYQGTCTADRRAWRSYIAKAKKEGGVPEDYVEDSQWVDGRPEVPLQISE